MKQRFLILLATLLAFLAACGDSASPSKPDYTKIPDVDAVRKHLEDAIHNDDLGSRHDKDTGVRTYRNKDRSLFTGWAKTTRGDGAAKVFYVENGLKHGPRVTYYGDGSTMDAGWRREGKMHGLYHYWNREGELARTVHYENGLEVEK